MSRKPGAKATHGMIRPMVVTLSLLASLCLTGCGNGSDSSSNEGGSATGECQQEFELCGPGGHQDGLSDELARGKAMAGILRR